MATNRIGGVTLDSGAEINAFDSIFAQLFVVFESTELQIVDLSNPTNFQKWHPKGIWPNIHDELRYLLRGKMGRDKDCLGYYILYLYHIAEKELVRTT